MIEVHQFKVRTITTGDWEYPPFKRTAEAIAEAKGVITPETVEMVFLSMLDSQGRYFPNIREQEDT